LAAAAAAAALWGTSHLCDPTVFDGAIGQLAVVRRDVKEALIKMQELARGIKAG
jgi:hypothetical protein